MARSLEANEKTASGTRRPIFLEIGGQGKGVKSTLDSYFAML